MDMMMIALLPIFILVVLFIREERLYKQYDKDTNAAFRRGRKDFVAASPDHTFYQKVYPSYDDLSQLVVLYTAAYVAMRLAFITHK
jgi:plasmid replication initiation protein